MNTIKATKEMSGDRRAFLKNTGMGLAAAAMLYACKKKDDDNMTPASGTDEGVNLGSGDVGILNYAYALEQLEAAFYTMVVADAKFSTIFSSKEQDLLKDIKAHEIVHREFFKAALAGNAIPALEVNFSSIDFGNRASVLGAAKTFEDLGVAAYNGAGHSIETAGYLVLAGKIVSVEARHAAAIRQLIGDAESFAGDDTVSADKGLDKALSTADVLKAASAYLKTKINGSNLPK